MVPMPPHPTSNILAISRFEGFLSKMYESTRFRESGVISDDTWKPPEAVLKVFPLPTPLSSILNLNDQLLGKVIPVTCVMFRTFYSRTVVVLEHAVQRASMP